MNNSIKSRILLGILEFQKRHPLTPRKTRIPYRDPRVKSEDDIVGNSRLYFREFENSARNSRFAQQAHLIYQVFLYRLDLGSCVW